MVVSSPAQSRKIMALNIAPLLLAGSLCVLSACSSSGTDPSASDMGGKGKKIGVNGTGGGSTTTTTTTPTPTPTTTTTSTVTYDTSIGTSVDADGFAQLPLRSGAHRYFVNSTTGSDANGCSGGQSSATPLKTITAGLACVTNGLGDQVLLAEGTSYSDVLGSGNDPTWLAFKQGYSAQYPTVIESYDPNDPTNEAKYGRGDQRNARPVLVQKQNLLGNGTYSYIAIKGLDFNPGNLNDAGVSFLGKASYILIENNIFRYTGLSFDTGESQTVFPTTQKIIVRNNSLYGMWSTGGRDGGLYVAGYVDGTLEDNVFYHDGWKIGASRDDDPSVGGATVFSHSYYLQTNTTGMIVRRNLSADGAGDGGIARGDSVFSENLFIDNPAAIGVGGGPNYNTERPTGVTFDVGYNAIIGSEDVTSTHPLGWAISTTNGQSGSRVHNNLIVRSANINDPAAQGFSNNAAFNQPSYAQYDHNVMYQWVAPTGGVYWPSCGNFPAQCFTTYDSNIWDGPAQGTNTNSAATAFPSPYTAAQLYAALGYADKTAFINYAINHPEAHIQRAARSLLFTGYGMQ
jgi:hypothetical protein